VSRCLIKKEGGQSGTLEGRDENWWDRSIPRVGHWKVVHTNGLCFNRGIPFTRQGAKRPWQIGRPANLRWGVNRGLNGGRTKKGEKGQQVQSPGRRKNLICSPFNSTRGEYVRVPVGIPRLGGKTSVHLRTGGPSSSL